MRYPLSPAPIALELWPESQAGWGDDRGVSAAALAEGHLWLANDECNTLLCLPPDGRGGWGPGRAFDLALLLDLPGKGEIDIEGLAVADGWLWLVGSQAGRRGKAQGAEGAAAVEALEGLRWTANRWLLARLPLDPAAADGPTLVRDVVVAGGLRRAASLRVRPKLGTVLSRHLAADTLLGPFLGLPAKENGLDVEVLAVRGDQLLLGLRGPVPGGLAVLLQLTVQDGAPGRLKLQPRGDTVYSRQLLDLGGLGIRDLAWAGDDLLILAGPTMDLPFAARLVRWPDAAAALQGGETLTPASAFEVLADVPTAGSADRAEACTALDGRADGRLLVAYDRPNATRLGIPGSRTVTVDLFAPAGDAAPAPPTTTTHAGTPGEARPAKERPARRRPAMVGAS